MSNFNQFALIGPTASGKTNLAIELADKNSAYILSLDSLAIYKEINIASAKPLMEERKNIHHFGLDVIFPNEPFDVTTFIKLYQKAKEQAIKDEKNLIIVGGTSNTPKDPNDNSRRRGKVNKSAIDRKKTK